MKLYKEFLASDFYRNSSYSEVSDLVMIFSNFITDYIEVFLEKNYHPEKPMGAHGDDYEFDAAVVDEVLKRYYAYHYPPTEQTKDIPQVVFVNFIREQLALEEKKQIMSQIDVKDLKSKKKRKF